MDLPSNTINNDAIQEILDIVKNNMSSVSNSDSTDFGNPKNPLDPEVVFDPEYGFSAIVLPYSYNSDISGQSPSSATNPDNTLKTEAVRVPLVKLNNKVIINDSIQYMDISINGFLPKIELKVRDINRNIQATDVPGMNNIITVILTAPVDGASKKISLDFYIDTCKFNDDGTITYLGTFKLIGLKQVLNKQIGDDKLSTYEMLEKIAKELKLGYATSPKCKEISDKRYRNIYSKTYPQYIMDSIKYGGLDNESIFDCWIDEYGYLMLVNLSHIMNEKIDMNQLTTKVIKGVTNTIPGNEIPDQAIEEVIRMITNSREYSHVNNLFFDHYKSKVDNSKIVNKGTSNKYFYLSSPCDENLIQNKSIVVMEESVDGIEGFEEYQFQNTEFIGVEQEEELPILVQKENVENFMNKFTANELIVELPRANYSLERGMLVIVFLEEYIGVNKKFIIDNYPNISKIEKSDDNEDISASTSGEDINMMLDQNNGVINPGISGIYYIHGVDFIYDGNEDIIQRLTLIKKGSKNKLVNKYTNIHLTDV